MTRTQRDKRRWLRAMVLAIVYIGSYIALSRRGFAQADEWGVKGFYFFLPADTVTWRVCNYGCVVAYYPLILVDNWLGTGRPVAHEPLWHLSK